MPNQSERRRPEPIYEPIEEPVQLRLGGFDAHGTTRARIGRKWFEVEHGIPGEVVAATVSGGRRPQGHIVEVIEPAPDRIDPPCEYFRDWKCGGCQWQQIAYEGQIERKRRAVDAAMAATGLAQRVDRVFTSPPWRYRSTAGIALGRHAGFRRRASLAIVPIRDCPISHPAIGALMAALNDALAAGHLANFHGRLRLDLRVVREGNGEGLQVMVRPDTDRRPPREDLDTLVSFLVSLPMVSAVSFTLITGEVETAKGERFGTVEVAGRPVHLASGSFFQTNLHLLPTLIERLREEAGDLTGKRLADVYAGAGLFGLFLSRGTRDVAVIETDPLALEAGERTARDWGVTSVRFLRGRAEDILEGDGPYDVVILDPPRSGLSPDAVRILTEQRPSRLLYVSCLAESLARDLVAFTAAGYAVSGLELFDFYPQTYHVELLAVLTRD